ncbi:hypothetical protein DCAR_0830485 [Daucus carota subsp. sativus]|uniref:Uncharacterized protein n=1 Tax=Daucus carota subsp. sativus TaxID=79200 RepID=A0A175YJQ3_DAUCS|nr:hypothetical protein DCAR_0830485 [Daucus carota subsp. sativus]
MRISDHKMIIAALVLYLALYGAVDVVNSTAQTCHDCVDLCLKNGKNDQKWEGLYANLPAFYKCEESCAANPENVEHQVASPIQSHSLQGLNNSIFFQQLFVSMD